MTDCDICAGVGLDVKTGKICDYCGGSGTLDDLEFDGFESDEFYEDE